MKTASILPILALVLLLAGCNNSPAPLDAGSVVSGTVWQHPVGANVSNSGSAIPSGSKVDVYERVIIIHRNDGSREVVPLDRVSGLKLK